MDCLFCKIISGKIAAKKVWEDDKAIAILDIKPISDGHLLVIPKKHTEDIFDLSNDEYKGIFQTAKKLAIPLKEVMRSKKVGLIVEGFGVPHVHIHLVPISKAYELNPEKTHEVDESKLDQVATKISTYLATKL